MMTNQAQQDATTLQALIADNEAWLVDRVIFYAKRQGYTRYTSTLREAWHQSVAGLSQPLLEVLGNGLPNVELVPDEDYTEDPLTQFGIVEARRHRQRGVELAMFLGLMKYYRQSYMDLIDRETADEASRQLANRTITNEKNKYLTIFESLQSPVAVFREDGCIDAVNHAWAVLFGRSKTPGSYYYAPQEKECTVGWLSEEIDAFAASEETERTIHKAVQTNLGERLFNMKIKRMLDVSEKYSGTVIMLDDVTQQKQTEEALHETTIWMTETFNALEEAVFIETPNGRIVDANRAAQQIFGYAIDELKDRTTKSLHVDHDHYNAFTAMVRKALAEKDTATFEYPARRKNGDVFPSIINITRLPKKDRTPLGIVSVLRDISSQKRAEEAARSSERFQGALELAGAVCHDMNQPLMAITGYAELLLMDCPEDSPLTDKLKKISEQVAKMGAITQKLMRVTRYETKMYMDQQIIDIDKSSSDDTAPQ